MGVGPPLELCLFGAATDTSNLGVSALSVAALSAIARRAPDARVTVFDNGWGTRRAHLPLGGGFDYDLRGARLSRRLHRRESLWNMRVSGFLGGLANPGIAAIERADAVLDVSGGDSFSDLYGEKRFRSVVLPKRIVLERGGRLILLPQTYGPYRAPSARREAVKIVRAAAMAWARDARSYEVLRDLLGPSFEPNRHRVGVDMAFLLEPRDPSGRLDLRVRDWIESARDEPILGLNVSGLLYNDAGASTCYGLRGDYRMLVQSLVKKLIHRFAARVLLVPHVMDGATEESDVSASAHLVETLDAPDRERVAVVATKLGPAEAKWLIAQCDWFCGTRMHSTIAALSSGVPTAAIAYSGKTRGVFDTCGQGEQVADARVMTAGEVTDVLTRSCGDRLELRASIAERLPEVLDQARSQMDTVVSACRSARDHNGAPTGRGGADGA